MKWKRFLAISLALLLITTLFAGCGAASFDGGDKNAAAYGDAEMGSVSDSLADQTSGSTETATPANQKLIRTLYLDAETEDMDTLLPQVEAKTAELGGYIEGREVYNGSSYSGSRYRHASLTIRIPADKLDSFVSHVAENSNITSNRETTEDVTLKYVATESRITALQTEQTRLLELLAKAETMDDLLKIESRLTEVRAELEQVTSQLRLYDNLVDYGTIHLELSEVVEYTEPKPESAWARMGTGFMESLEGIGDGFTEIFIFLVARLPYLVLIAIVATLVLFFIKRRKKKAPKKETPPEE